jgi:hypothetical protein
MPKSTVGQRARKFLTRRFDPEGSGYDYESARKAGIRPDKTGHWPSREPRTGLILKGRKHPTFYKTVAADKKLGYMMQKKIDGRYYSIKKTGLRGMP